MSGVTRPSPDRLAATPTPDDAGTVPPVPDGPVLVVTAHPDDVDFGMGGTIAAWRRAGVDVRYCIVTDGDAGGFDAAVTRPDMARLRQAEQRAAAAAVGVEHVEFLGHPDGRVTVSLELRRDLSRVIRRLRPAVVLTQSPERNFERIFASHPDHLAVGEATLCAVYPDARNQFAHPELLAEGLDEHAVGEVWMAGGPNPNVWVDITDTFDRKLDALACHVSQVARHEPLAFAERLRSGAAAQAALAGWADGRLAEGFRRISTA